MRCYKGEREGGLCPMCAGRGRIGAQETVVVPPQGGYRTIGGWVTKDALSQAPIVTWVLEVPAPRYQAGQASSPWRCTSTS